MSNRNTSYGGTDWSNGQILDAGDLNDTFNAVLTRTAGVFEFTSFTANTDLTLNFNGTTNSGQLLWKEDEDYFHFMDNTLVADAKVIYFRDTSIYINSNNDGHLDLTADASVDINSPATYFTSSGDITLNFTGGTNESIISWMEDEDYFKFIDDVLINSTEHIYFRDTAVSISSATDGHLDINADVSVDLNTPTINYTSSGDISLNFTGGTNTGNLI